MKVLFHYEVGTGLDKRVRSMAGDGIEIVYCDQDDLSRFDAEIQTADVLWHVLKPVTRTHIQSARQLKLIQKIGVGVNTIDLKTAENQGVRVCNMPGTNSRAVAEMTLLLMLGVLRLQPRLDAICRSGAWRPDAVTRESLQEIGGKTVGLVGFGDIPARLAPVLETMGCRVLYTARAPKQIPYEFRDLEALLAESDIVSLHVPLTDETKNLIDAARLRKMRPGSILINTARGGLVDEQALYQALVDGHLFGAGLDVFDAEPASASNPLFKLDQVMVAPHIAWLTQETLDRSLDVALRNTRAIRDGTPLEHCIV